MSYIFTLAGLLFASSFDFTSYLIFSFIAGISSKLFDTAFQSIESKIIDRNIGDLDTIDEFNLLEEIPLFFGRMIPFLFVVITKPTFENDLLLRVFVLMVSLIPFVISYILSNTYVTRRSKDPFVKG
ncbi:hypothetical protein JW796_03995 [Candidatus Dojkabacteria bacterium]|nr:hypothetical protein [Candidatus Dojkabacteria bacterium]